MLCNKRWFSCSYRFLGSLFRILLALAALVGCGEVPNWLDSALFVAAVKGFLPPKLCPGDPNFQLSAAADYDLF